MPDQPYNIDINPSSAETAQKEADFHAMQNTASESKPNSESESESAEQTEEQTELDSTKEQEPEIPLSYDPSDPRFFDRSQYQYSMETYEVPAEDLDDTDLYSPVQFRPYFDETTGRDLVEQLDTHGNIIERPVVRMRPVYETNKEIYHKLEKDEDPVHMYDTYDKRLHMVRDTNEFAQAVALHEQWVNTRNTAHPEGHQLQLAPDFRWDILQQQNLQKNPETGEIKDKTIENIRRLKAIQIYPRNEKLKEIQTQVTEQLDKEAQEHALKEIRAKYLIRKSKQSPKDKYKNMDLEDVIATVKLTDDVLAEVQKSKDYKNALATKASQEDINKAVKKKFDQYLNEMTAQTSLDLSYADIPNQENLNKYDLSGINFSHANLSGSTLNQCYLDGTDFTDADLEETVFRKCDLNNVNLRNTYLQNAAFLKSNINKTDFRDAKLKDTSFAKTTITDPYNWKQEWNRYQDGTDRNEFTQRTDDIVRTDPESKEPLKVLSQNEFDTLIYESKKQGIPPDLSHYNLSNIDFSNAKRMLHNDFSGINFSGSNLDGCDLSGCTLSHCNFTDCHAENCNFSHTLCTQTNFDHLIAPQCSFDCANMTGCTFTLADLQESTFNRTALSGVKFIGTNLTDSLFQNTIGQNNEFTPYQEPPSKDKDAQPKLPVRTNLSDARFQQSTLRDTKMDNAIVADTTFFRSKFSGDRSSITNTPMQDALFQSNILLPWTSLDKDPFFNYVQHRNFPEYDVTGTPSDRSPEDLTKEQDQLIHPKTPDEVGEKVDLNEPIYTTPPDPDQNGDIPFSRSAQTHVPEKDQTVDMSFQPEAGGVADIPKTLETQPDITDPTPKEHPISPFAVSTPDRSSAFRTAPTFPPISSVEPPIKSQQQTVSDHHAPTVSAFSVSHSSDEHPFQTIGLAELSIPAAEPKPPVVEKGEPQKAPEPTKPKIDTPEPPKASSTEKPKADTQSKVDVPPKAKPSSRGQDIKDRLLRESKESFASILQELNETEEDIEAQIKLARNETCSDYISSDKSKSHNPLQH